MLDPIELGRLAKIQKEPLRYVQRRVEKLALVDDYHYGVTVTQQVLIPYHNDSANPKETELLIPLGQYSKDRMPGLRVLGPDGELLPLLSRRERGELGAALFTAQWQKVFFNKVAKSDKAIADQIWLTIREFVARLVAGSETEAEVMIKALDSMVSAWRDSERHPDSVRKALTAWTDTTEIAERLRGLSKTRLLVARANGVPGRTYPITISYTERFSYRSRFGRKILEEALGWLGLMGRQVRRDVANMGQAASLWIVQSVPEGTEALRYYWTRDRHRQSRPDPVSVEMNRAVTAHHPSASEKHPQNEVRLEIQLAPSSAIAALVGLSALLLLVSTYVYQAIPEVNTFHHAATSAWPSSFTKWGAVPGGRRGPDNSDRVLLVGLGSVFAAIPAAVVGALAYRGQSFARRISRGPRVMASLLCVMTAFFAVIVSLKNLEDWSETTAYVVSLYCFWLIGIGSYIQWGPRWRKSERSRRRGATHELSATACRRRQFWAGLAFFAGWTLVSIGFARCQAGLQISHFFTSEFPGNIWRVLWA